MNQNQSHHGAAPSRAEAFASIRDINALRQGFPYELFEQLCQLLEVRPQTLLPASRVARRRKAGRMTPSESDRMYCLWHLYQTALQVFGGDRERVLRWLGAPNPLLGGESPLQRADTCIGAREAEDLLHLIEHPL